MRLTKETLDAVRDIDGFPVAKDEDIISVNCNNKLHIQN